MPVNNPPYPTDPVSQGGDVFPRGSYAWVKFRLTVGNQNPAPPDSDALERVDIYKLLDPDSVIIGWATNAIDTNDETDDYDSSHGDYVGFASIRTITDGVLNSTNTITSATAAFNGNDVGKRVVGTGIPVGATIQTIVDPTSVTISAPATATASGVTLVIGTENVGLFAEGGVGATSGRFALKIFIPGTAEETALTSLRYYTAQFRLKKNGQITTPRDGDETFDVGPAGVIVFSSALVSVAEVKAGILTSLSDADIMLLIDEATVWVEGVLDACGIDVDSFVADGLPPLVRMGIVLYARGLIFDLDASSGRKVSMIQEGTKRVGLSGNSSKDSDSLRGRATEALELLCKRYSQRRRHQFGVIKRDVIPLGQETYQP